MTELAQTFCSTFCQRLHDRVGEARAFGVVPNDRDWMESFLILFALEDCQRVFSKGQLKPICRFSMGVSTDKARAKLQDYLKTLRAERLKAEYQKTAASVLHESLVDFSMSNYSLPQATGDGRATPIPKGERFELLMVAESEMGSKPKVLEDFLKLTCVYAPFKVMVYKAYKRPADNKALVGGFEHVIGKARKKDDSAEWLFLGIPGYSEWVAKWDDPVDLNTSIHYVGPQQTRLVQHNEWWTWPKAK